MRIRVFILGLLLAASTQAQLLYRDASVFPLLGKATDATLTRYERLPASLESVSRKPLWDLGRNSAGLALRFRSNSTCIGAKWEVRDNRNMNHMTPTGIKGLDLYCLQDGKWVFAGSGRPQGKVNEATIVRNMDPEEREYLLYLSLYDGVTHWQSVWIAFLRLTSLLLICRYVRSPLFFMGPVFCRVVVLPVPEWPIQIFWNVGSIVNVSI